MREDNGNNSNNENEDFELLNSDDNTNDKLSNNFKNLLEKGGHHYITENTEKDIFDNFIKLTSFVFSPKTLSESYEKNIPFKPMTKKIIKKNTTKEKLFFMLDIILSIFNICYSTAIFQLIKMDKAIFNVLYYAVIFKLNSWIKNPEEIEKFSIEDFNNNYNFFYQYFEDSRRNIFNFNLILITSFIGTFLLKKIGFRISCFILSIITLVAILFIILVFPFSDYDTLNNTYSGLNILFLFFISSLLKAGVGGLAMLSQQMTMDKRDKCNKYFIKLNNKEANIKNDQMKINNQDIQIIEESEFGLIALEEYLSPEDESNEINENIELQETLESTMQNLTIYNENIVENNNNQNNNNNQTENVNNNNNLNENASSETITQNRKEKLDRVKNLIEKNNSDDENKFDNLDWLFVTTMIACISEFCIINIFLSEEDENNLEYMEISACNKNYNCFQNVKKDKLLSVKNKKLFDTLISKITNENLNNFKYICIIIYALIIISNICYTIFDTMFTKAKKNQKEEGIEIETSIYEFLGKMYFSIEISLKKKMTCCQKICNYFKTPIKSFIILFNFIFTIINSILRFFYDIFSLEENSKYRFQIRDIGRSMFENDKTIFSLEYRKQSKSLYINNFFSDKVAKNISYYMIIYFFLRIMNLSFENLYIKLQNPKNTLVNSPKFGQMLSVKNNAFFKLSSGKNNDDNNDVVPSLGYNFVLKEEKNYIILIFVVSFLIFVYSTGVGNDIRILCKKKKNENNINESDTNANNENENMKEENKKEELAKGILGGIYSIFYVEGIYLIFISIIYLCNNENEAFKKDFLYLFTILLNKFYQFNMVYYCTRYSTNINKYEIMNGSFLIALLLNIIDGIIYLIKDYFYLENIYIQIIEILLCLLPIIGIFTAFKKSICCKKCEYAKEIGLILINNIFIFKLKDCFCNCFRYCCPCCCRNCCLRCSRSKGIKNLNS